jgi:hypothetical protein
MFGSPLPGVAEFDAECAVHRAGLSFANAFLDAFLDLWWARPADAPADPALDARIAEVAMPFVGPDGAALPADAFRSYLSGWTRLYGAVAMEVFGHLHWALTDVEPLFEAELRDFLRGLGAG